MKTYTAHRHPAMTHLGTGLLLICLLLLCTNQSWANRADWGLVQRFQNQMEQAQAGKVKAMYEVGHMYERGRGTTKNFEEAANWYQKAADGGNESAKAKLGKMYLDGRGVSKDLGKAYTLLLEAARSDVSSAQYQLGIMYEIGIGIPEDNGKALYWYQKAAELGHYQAERKVKKLANTSPSPYIANSAAAKTNNKPQAKAPKNTTKKTASASNNNLLDTIAKGSWHRGKRAAGYLPSNISNCKKLPDNTLQCISNEQERNTGSEIITFNTESSIASSGGKKFTIEYTNNVLEVEVVQSDIPSGIEGEEISAVSKSNAVQKGKQEKVHHLDCTLNNAKSITCLKNSIRTLEFKS